INNAADRPKGHRGGSAKRDDRLSRWLPGGRARGRQHHVARQGGRRSLPAGSIYEVVFGRYADRREAISPVAGEDPSHPSTDPTLSMGEVSDRTLSMHSLTAADLQFSPGTLLLDRFRIIRAIASGGMGTVFLATDEKLGQARAIKIARAGHARVLTPEAATAL